MIISRYYVTFRQLINSGDEAGEFFVQKLHESYPEEMWDEVFETLMDQCLYQREMGWAFYKLDEVLEKFNELDEKKPYDNLLSLSDVNDVELISKTDDYIELHLINKIFDSKSIVKVVVVEQ
jgi:hypothetical protein